MIAEEKYLIISLKMTKMNKQHTDVHTHTKKSSSKSYPFHAFEI